MQRLFNADLDAQVIIDFAAPNEPDHTEEKNAVKALGSKWDMKYPQKPPTQYVNGFNLLAGQAQKSCAEMFAPNETIKITLFAHGRYFLGLDPEVQLDVDKVADALAKFIGTSNVVLNLVVCAAARGSMDSADPYEGIEKSTAAKIHEALLIRLGRDIPVIARTQVVGVHNITGQKYTIMNSLPLRAVYAAFTALKNKKKGEDIANDILKKAQNIVNRNYFPKQKGSKVIFTANQKGQPAIEDNYFVKAKQLWQKEVIAKLSAAKDKTDVKDKKELLDRMIKEFEHLPAEEILFNLKQYESNNVINQHSPGVIFPAKFKSFFFAPDTKTVITDLITSGEAVFNSNNYVRVGNNNSKF